MIPRGLSHGKGLSLPRWVSSHRGVQVPVLRELPGTATAGDHHQHLGLPHCGAFSDIWDVSARCRVGVCVAHLGFGVGWGLGWCAKQEASSFQLFYVIQTARITCSFDPVHVRVHPYPRAWVVRGLP